MTLSEFADKYDIPYIIVYEAAYKLPSYSTGTHDIEYAENDLYAETSRIITQRCEKHRRNYHKTQKMLINLKSIKRMEEL